MPEEKQAEYTIKQAAVRMGLTEPYVRALIRNDKLPSELRAIGFESQVSRHMITEQAIATFLKETTRKSRRNDGRNKYVLYANPAEIILVDEAIRKAGLTKVADMIHSANNLKLVPKEVHNGKPSSSGS